MKILFIHKQNFMFFGVSALAGYIKKFGHTADVLIANKEKNLVAKIKEINPDIIGFSIMSNDYIWFLDEAQNIKKLFSEKLLIVGGTHCYLCSELIELPFVDIVCVGEGEKPLTNLLNALQNKNDYSHIKGLIIKKNNQIIKNEIDIPIQNLDEIPEDRSIYLNRYPHFKNENLLQVISSRGCPLYCSFCINGKINEFYKNQSIKFHRQKSPQFLINELKNFLILFPKTKTIFFPDDIFLLNKKFIKEFAELYSKEIAIPFVMTTFPFYIDDEIAKLLKNANCKIVMTAPETANEQHRFEIFKKKIKNQHFIDMSKIAKKHNLKIYTTAMFVYPKQTIDDVYKTIEFNHQLQTDIPFKSFLQPYPHTEIYEIALKNNNIPQNFSFQDLPQSYFLKSPLNHQQKNEITLIYYFYYFLVKYPSFYKLIKKRLYILKLIPFKTLINYFGIFLWFKNFKNLSSAAALLYMLRFWKDK